MNAPVSLPCAPRRLWPQILAAFQLGFDTRQIADGFPRLKLTEAEVANALHRMREEART